VTLVQEGAHFSGALPLALAVVSGAFSNVKILAEMLMSDPSSTGSAVPRGQPRFKLPYAKPELERYGSLVMLTRGGTKRLIDDHGANNMSGN